MTARSTARSKPDDQDALEERYRNYLLKRRKSTKVSFGDSYIKDKISRFRKLCAICDCSELSSIGPENYLPILDSIIHQIEMVASKEGCSPSKYDDHLVVIRQLYEMNTNGRKPPLFTHYARQLRPNLRNS